MPLDVLTALTARVSPTRLTEPAPGGGALDQIVAAGLRAPDHGRLRPWRFILIEGQARARFGEVLAQVAKQRDPSLDERRLQFEREKPLRAPLIIVVAATVQEDGKVPAVEQVLSAGAAAQNMLTAAHALGFGGFWRTGAPAYDAEVKRALGLRGSDQIVALLYLGSIETPGVLKPVNPSDIVVSWRGPSAG